MHISSDSPFDRRRDHGYGMAAEIDYLVDHYGNKQGDILVRIYESIENGEHPVDAIIKHTESPDVWLEPFFRSYLSGKIYNLNLSNYWQDKAHSKFEIRSESYKTTFNENYQDLSAKYFLIDTFFDDTDNKLPDNISLEFNLLDSDPKTEISVFKWRYGVGSDFSFEFLKKSLSQVVIDDFKELAYQAWGFLALITNKNFSPPYTNEKEIGLEIKLTNLIEYTGIRHDSQVLAKYHWTNETSGRQWEVTGDHYTGFWGSHWNAGVADTSSSYIDNIFTYTSTAEGDYGHTATITATFNPTQDTVLTYEANIQSMFGNSNKTLDSHVIFKNIPRQQSGRYVVGSPPDASLVNGWGTCDHIFKYTITRKDVHNDSLRTMRINTEGFQCNGGSYIDLKFFE
jgi:hypothetical protein